MFMILLFISMALPLITYLKKRIWPPDFINECHRQQSIWPPWVVVCANIHIKSNIFGNYQAVVFPALRNENICNVSLIKMRLKIDIKKF